ncbi:hypothetical protein K432DRAFT_425420 [Lepidopterella palustris CBS 459.81]|uniref:2EXR domain-containing protein n=1 Tax=Lepidopterella palustris CBS 459.81 TaxID=1314670 RepID=A0A8E2JFV4_9PEZI|nr:hypothetical protein K432DRAFT_425420 [Lepidopterella palustris CBS 459.81]
MLQKSSATPLQPEPHAQPKTVKEDPWDPNRAEELPGQCPPLRRKGAIISRFNQFRKGLGQGALPSEARAEVIVNASHHSPVPMRPNISTEIPKDSFMKLPGELRNEIYSLLLFPTMSTIRIYFLGNPKEVFKTILQSSIFRVNQQIRAEALSYFCSMKSFEIMNVPSAMHFLKYIGPLGRAHLASLTLTFYHFKGDPGGMMLQSTAHFLKECKGLKSVKLQLEVPPESDFRVCRTRPLYLAPPLTAIPGLKSLARSLSTMENVSLHWSLIWWPTRIIPVEVAKWVEEYSEWLGLKFDWRDLHPKYVVKGSIA